MRTEHLLEPDLDRKPNGGTWGRVSKAAALDRQLTSATFRVLAVLACYVDKAGYCYPAVGTIAAHLGLTRRMVQLHLRRLEDRRYITTLHRYRTSGGAGLRSNGARQGGGFSVNAYLLKYPPAPSLAADGNAQDDE